MERSTNVTSHDFDERVKRTGHYPTARFKSLNLTVRVAPGYISLKRDAAEIYIPYRQLIHLLKWLVPLVRRMDPDRHFDPQTATSAYLKDEFELRQALRNEKRQKYGVRRRRRRH